MAKYRCPKCGATHKEDMLHCRLCGSAMGTEGEEPVYLKPIGGAIKKRPSILLFVAAGLVAVVGLAALALSLGWVGGGDTVQRVVGNVPGLTGRAPDGWVIYTTEEGRFSAEFPEEPEEIVEPVPFGDGELTRFVGRIGEDTIISVGYTELGEAPGGPRARLLELTDDVASLEGAVVLATSDARVSGLAGVQVELGGITLGGRPALGQSMLVIDGEDRLYVITTISVFHENEYADRMVARTRLGDAIGGVAPPEEPTPAPTEDDSTDEEDDT